MFWPGFHKEELYSEANCKSVPGNFRLLTARTPHAKLGGEIPGASPGGKLGHDPRQLLVERLKESSGLISVGDITRCAEVSGHPGHIEIDVKNVPTRLVGGEIAAGRYNSGSVELKGQVRDPRDPAKFLPGSVLTAIAFLGEEPPALNECHPDLQARTKPRATFADGRPVPANPEPPPELVGAMSDVMRYHAAKFSGEYDPRVRRLRIGGREFSAHTVCFSDFDPNPEPRMTPEQEAALQAAGFTPEQIAAMKAALPGATTTAAAAPPGQPQVPATSPTMSDDMPPWAKEMSDCVKRMSAELDESKKRVGELQASAEAAQKKDEEAKMAAFSDQVDRAALQLARKVSPVVVDKVHKPTLMGILTAKTFSAEGERVKAFNDYLAPLVALPDDPRLTTASRTVTPADARVTTPEGQSVLKHLAVTNPRAVGRLAAPAA